MYILNPQLSEAIMTVLAECKNEYATNYLYAINEAVSYAESTGHATADRAIKTQINYALCNMAGWKGESAREAKKILRKYGQGKGSTLMAGTANINLN